MKTIYETKFQYLTIFIIFAALFSFGFYSISASSPDIFSFVKNDSPVKIRTYRFDTKENGKTIHWTAVIRKGNIDLLYKNDEKLSDNEIAHYNDMVLEQTKKLDESLDSIDEFHYADSCFYFDSDAFRKQMKELRERIENFKFDFHFDKENYKKMMDHLQKNLEELKTENFFDKDKMEELNRKLSESFRDHKFDFHFDIDMDRLNMNLGEISLKMKDLKIDMTHLKERMKELKEFLKDVKAELVKDGYLDENDEDFDFEFTKDKIEVNGKRLPDNLLEKYKRIYKEHFGKEVSDHFRIIN